MIILNGTAALAENAKTQQFNPRIVFIFLLLITGVLGNFLALLILAQKKTAINKKCTFMLRCLTTSNLVGLLGILTELILKRFISKETQQDNAHCFCVAMLIWRAFGLSSGCIAAVMAIDRWFVLAAPSYYQKHITFKGIQTMIAGLVSFAIILTFLPFVGFGLYFNEETRQCQRYRDADNLKDKSYAVLFMIFGTLLCTVIVSCNLFVTRVLCLVGRRRATSYSSSIIDSSNSMSPDEMKFAKIMLFLSISFVVCWMPNMISVIFALKTNPLPRKHWFFLLSDFLIALHFATDPYVYVFSNAKLKFGLSLNFIKCWICCDNRSKKDHKRLKTSDDSTTQNTVDLG